MTVHPQEQQQRDHIFEIAEQWRRRTGQRVNNVRNRETDLQVNKGTGRLYHHKHQVSDKTEKQAD
ncbi:hypothetical protein D3C73_1561760 [compost metagenome]